MRKMNFGIFATGLWRDGGTRSVVAQQRVAHKLQPAHCSEKMQQLFLTGILTAVDGPFQDQNRFLRSQDRTGIILKFFSNGGHEGLPLPTIPRHCTRHSHST